MGHPKIWLTGSRGFIGRALVSSLRSADADLTCLTQNKKAANGPSDQADPVYLDYLDPAAIENKVKTLGLPDIFIHLGWGDVSIPESPYHLKENLQMGKNLIGTLFKLGLKKFIFIGSADQYGERSGKITEDMGPQGNVTNYAKAKNEVEEYGLHAAAGSGKIFISVRVFYVYGAYQRSSSSLVNYLFRSYLKKQIVNLSSWEQYRDYIHITDTIEGLKRICSIDHSTIVNLGSGKAVQVKDFALGFWKEMGGDLSQLKFTASLLKEGEHGYSKSYADLARLAQLTQWKPQLTLQEGMKMTRLGSIKK